MPHVQIRKQVDAPIERVFDLCRSVEVHLVSTSQTKEQVVRGRQSGLLQLNETVTWEATHLGVRQQLKAY